MGAVVLNGLCTQVSPQLFKSVYLKPGKHTGSFFLMVGGFGGGGGCRGRKWIADRVGFVLLMDCI